MFKCFDALDKDIRLALKKDAPADADRFYYITKAQAMIAKIVTLESSIKAEAAKGQPKPEPKVETKPKLSAAERKAQAKERAAQIAKAFKKEEPTLAEKAQKERFSAIVQQAYGNGDLEIPQYMVALELLHRNDMAKIRELLDEYVPNYSSGLPQKVAAKGSVDLKRLLSLVGSSMYRANLAETSIKEMVQNSFDAVKAEVANKKALKGNGRIDVKVDRYNRLIAIRDNGKGMEPKTILNAFLTVAGSNKEGLEGGLASGGFGMAKAAFLYGNSKIYLRTVRNGKVSTLITSGDELLDEKGKASIDVQDTDEPNGTLVMVKVPETVEIDGEQRTVWFPSGYSNIDFFQKPLLNDDVTITYDTPDLDPDALMGWDSAEAWSRAEMRPENVKIGKHFDLSGYGKPTQAKFDWGTAEIYMGKQRIKDRWDMTHQILSAGVYQFDDSVTDSSFQKVPYRLIINVKPKVEASSANYPFNLKREGWKDVIEEDVKALKKYIVQVANGISAKETADVFKNIKTLPKIDVENIQEADYAKLENFLERPKAAGEKAPAKPYTPPVVTVTGGTVTGNNEKGDKVVFVDLEADKKKEKNGDTSMQVDKPAPMAADYLLNMGIDKNLPVFHNNTDFDYTGTDPRAVPLFAELGDILLKAREKVDSLGLTRFIALRSQSGYFMGISIDKSYHGVHVMVPFNGIFLNPLAVKGTTLPSIAYGLYDTIVHEFAHIVVKNHGEEFTVAYHDLAARLAADGFDLQMRTLLQRILKKHKDTFLNLRDHYESSTTKNIAKSLHEGEGSSGTAAVRGPKSGSDPAQGVDGAQSGNVPAGRGGQGGQGLPGDAGLYQGGEDREGAAGSAGALAPLLTSVTTHDGIAFETGKPVTFNYSHNKESATKLFGKPKKDSQFMRYYEPSGQYMVQITSIPGEPSKNHEYGQITFNNPLVIDNNSLNWKQQLSEAFGGKRGKHLSKAVIAAGYDGIVTVDAAYNGQKYTSEIVNLTNFDEAKAMYSKADNTLAIVHNLTLDNLIHADKIGGLPAPSLAVVDKNHPLDSFGDITLVADKDQLGPSRDTPFFNADIYSPRYPTVQYDVDNKAWNKAMEALSPEAKSLFMPSLSEMESKGVGALRYYSALRYEYLKEQGEAPPMQYKEPVKIRPELQKFLDNYDGDRYQLSRDPVFIEAVRKIVNSAFKKNGYDKERMIKPGSKEAQNLANQYSYDVAKAFNEKSKGPEIDRYAVEKAISDKLDEDGYYNWLREKYSHLITKERIFNGFTPMGNRRYLPHNLDTVVRLMTKKTRGGEGFNYGVPSIRAHAAKQFKTVKALQDARKNLVSEADMKALKEEVNAEYEEIEAELEPYKRYQRNEASEALAGLASKGYREFNEYFQDVPRETMQRIVDFLGKLKNMPSEYYEGKAKRAVRIGEFSAAIVPVGKHYDKAVEILNRKGITNIARYDKKEPGARAKALQTLTDLHFSKGGKGTGSTVAQVKNWLTKPQRKLLEAGRLEIVQSTDDLPGSLKARGEALYAAAWHGSPHDFDRFDSGKIGTGEGAAVYGHGLYFAEKKEIAEWYKKQLSPRAEIKNWSFGSVRLLKNQEYLNYSPKNNTPLEHAKANLAEELLTYESNIIDAYEDGGLPAAKKKMLEIADGVIEYANNEYQEILPHLKVLRKRLDEDLQFDVHKVPGKVYQVELAPKDDEYLDWDKPLSKQSDKVRKILAKHKAALEERFAPANDFFEGGREGMTLYSDMENSVSAADASKYLHSIGIRGIRYLAGQIQGNMDEKASNYVIFSDQDVSITDKYSKSYRSIFPKVRGGWTKDKIRRVLKQTSFSASSGNLIHRTISEFDSPADLKEHIFYHGTGGYVDRALRPSINMSERDAARNGGGGYGERYWAISLSKSKEIASNFTGQSSYGRVYPVILKKDAVVIDRPDLSDASELDDIIVDLWNQGVDAVRLGDWSKDHSEQELAVLNPAAIFKYNESESFAVFNKKKFAPLTDTQIAEIYQKAVDAVPELDRARRLPKEQRDAIQSQIKSRPLQFSQLDGVEGLYQKANDKIYLVADMLNQDNVQSVLVHEQFHRALQVDEKVKSAYDRFNSALSDQFRRAAKGLGSKQETAAYKRVISSETPLEHQLEEYAAYLISAHNQRPESLSAAIRKAIADLFAAIRAALIRAGVSFKDVNAADLSALARYGLRLGGKISPKSPTGKSNTYGNNLGKNIRASAQAKRFYSALTRMVVNAPNKVFGNGKQVVAWLNSQHDKFGVKKDEIFWSGITDYLEMAGKVTRDDILDYLKANGVQVNVVKLESGDREMKRHIEKLEDRKAEIEQELSDLSEPNEENYWVEPDEEDGEDAEPWFDEAWFQEDWDDYIRQTRVLESHLSEIERELEYIDPNEYGYTEHHDWRTDPDNGENYQETLLTLPLKAGKPKKVDTTGWEVEHLNTLSTGQRELRVLDAQGNMISRRGATWDTNAQAIQQAASNLQRRYDEEAKLETKLYHHSHWEQSNVLAHYRSDERTDANGDRFLFVNEIQSDWGQQGRDQGFNDPAEQKRIEDKLTELKAKKSALSSQLNEAIRTDDDKKIAALGDEKNFIDGEIERLTAKKNSTGIPPAPFVTDTKSWVRLALKHIIADAVERGLDKIAFVSGKQAAKMFNLSSHIKKIVVGPVGQNGMRWAELLGQSHQHRFKLEFEQETGKVIKASHAELSDKPLSEVVGKELADKILSNRDEHVLNDADLHLGEDAMTAFYDGIVPPVVREIARKMGGEVGRLQGIKPPKPYDVKDYHVVIIESGINEGSKRVVDANGTSLIPAQSYNTEKLEAAGKTDEELIRLVVEEANIRAQNVYQKQLKAARNDLVDNLTLTITPAMRDKVVNEGMPLFSRKASESLKVLPESLKALGETIDINGKPRPTRNSEGQLIHPTEEGIRNFYQWFGDSKVVDNKGRPLVVYHGTGKDFSKFKAPTENEGMYFTSEPDYAGGYAEAKADAQNGNAVIYSSFLTIKNPLILDGENDVNWEQFTNRGFDRKALTKQGYDGVLLKYGNGDVEVMAFKPNQIKSATGNTGTFSPESNDIRYSKAAPKDTLAEAKRKAGLAAKKRLGDEIRHILTRGLEANAQAVKEQLAELKPWLAQGIFDKFLGIKRAEQAILGDVAHSQSGYIGARLSTGSVSTMNAVLQFGAPEWRDGIIQKKAGSKGLAEVLQPVKNDLENFAAWMVGRRANRLFKEGRENNFTRAEIDALMALEKPEYQEAAQGIAAMNTAILDLAQDAGLINPDSRALFEHNDYIPFYRIVDGSAKGVRNKRGLSHQSSGIRVLKGGDNVLSDPLGNMMQNWNHLIDASMKNNALDKTLNNLEGSDFIEKLPNAQFKPAIVPKSEIVRVLKEAGVPEEMLDSLPDEVTDGLAKMWSLQPPMDPDVVRVMREGKSAYYRVNDPMLLTSLVAVNQTPLTGIFNWLRKAKSLLTGAVTADPTFMLRNFIRDSMHSWTIAEDKGFRFGIHSIHGAMKTLKEEGGYIDMMFAGASFQGGYGNYGEPGRARETMDAVLRRRGIKDIRGFQDSILDTPKKYWEMYRAFGDAIENANREAVLYASRRAGHEKAQYVFEAKDLMDFSMQGSFTIVRALSDMLPFFNARLVGLYRLFNAGKTDEARRFIMAKGLSIAMLTLALLAINGDDERYEELEDWDKDQYWHFFVGDQHFRLPKPFELGLLFGTVPERSARMLLRKDSLGDFGGRMLAGLRDTLAFNPVPQLFNPLAELYANKDYFTERPIENESDQGKLPSARYNERTSETMRALSAALPEGLEASPKRLEHLLHGYLGAMGMYALGVSDLLVRTASGMPESPSLRVDQLPVVKALYQQTPAKNTRYTTEFYDMLNEVNEIYTTINAYKKEGQPEKAEALSKDSADKLKYRPEIVKTGKKLSELRKAVDAIYRSDLPGDEKRRQIDGLMQRSNAFARAIVKKAYPSF